MNIDKKLWHSCKLCNKKISVLAKKYGGDGIYYSQVFNRHLETDHHISLDAYFEPRFCPCGICKKRVKVFTRGSNIKYAKYACGRNPGLMDWSEKAKESRKGKNNPMYGATPWNKGETAESNSIVRRVSEKMTGRDVSEETKKKQSKAAKKRKIHGHTGHKHTEESKEKMRQATIRNIKLGKFKQTRSKPHVVMCEILDSLNIEYTEEASIDCWVFDIYLTQLDIYIEVDGDYFHSNPKIYPNGAKTNTQKINWYRDIKKNKYCDAHNIRLIRYWESDILNNEEEIKCELNQLKK